MALMSQTRDPRRLKHAPQAEQRAFLIAAVRADPVAGAILERAVSLGAPDWALCAGAVYQNVWNALTGRPPGHGVRDYDLAYCDLADLSWAGEDAVIARARALFADLPAPVEVRNQARVHLWFEARFGEARAPLTSVEAAIAGYAAHAHSVGVRPTSEGTLEVLAPHGLEAVFDLAIAPARRSAHTADFRAKVARMRAIWPELRVDAGL